MSLAKQIGSVSKTALTNAGHMNMNNEIYARILDTTVAALHLEALAPGYKECIDREAECVNRVTKSASTAQLEAKDKERDKTLQFIYSMNGSYKVCPDETLRTPALLVDSVLRAYDTRRNREVWRQRFGGALYTTPLVAEGLVIAGTTTDGLRAYDARTGRERWHIDTPTPIVGQGLVDGRGSGAALYIGLGNGTMAKIAVRDGRILWCYDYGRGQSQGQPALADGKLVFGAWNGHLHCLDAATGKLGWKWTNGSKSLFLSPGNIVPRIAGGRVFIDAPDRAVTCLDLASGSVVWRCTDYKAREASGMSADSKRFYVKTMDGELLAIDTAPDAFRRLWISPAGFGYDYTACPVTVSGGIAYLADRSGNVAAVREDGTPLWCVKCCNSAANFITEAPDGSLWATFAEGKIFRIPPHAPAGHKKKIP